MCQLITTIWKPCEHRREKHFRLHCLSLTLFGICPTGDIRVDIRRPTNGSRNAQMGMTCGGGFCPDCLKNRLTALYEGGQQ